MSASCRMRPPLLSRRVETRAPRNAFSRRTRLGREGGGGGEAAFADGRRGSGNSDMAYLNAGVAPVTPALGVADWPNPSASSFRPMESTLAAGRGRTPALAI